MSGIWQDVRHATRSLIKSPMITVIAVMTLALGIGANTAIYTVLDATLLSPPPYENPDRLVAVWGILPARDIDTWPVDSRGTDNSVVGNPRFGPVSRFSHGSREPYMAVYHPRTEAGVVHYSSPFDLPAKKIWSWGSNANGALGNGAVGGFSTTPMDVVESGGQIQAGLASVAVGGGKSHAVSSHARVRWHRLPRVAASIRRADRAGPHR